MFSSKCYQIYTTSTVWDFLLCWSYIVYLYFSCTVQFLISSDYFTSSKSLQFCESFVFDDTRTIISNSHNHNFPCYFTSNGDIKYIVLFYLKIAVYFFNFAEQFFSLSQCSALCQIKSEPQKPPIKYLFFYKFEVGVVFERYEQLNLSITHL